MTSTVLNRSHRQDTTHHTRSIGRLLREQEPGHQPPTFDPWMVADLPEPARQWLTHAIEPGTLLAEAIEIQMHGAILLGKWRPFTATQALVPDAGLVWAARTRIAGLPVRGSDSYVLGQGAMRWRVLGIVPVQSGTGYDVTRSAADRLAAEAVLLPTSLVSATWRDGERPDEAVYVRQVGNRTISVTIRATEDGRLLSAAMQRWGNPGGGQHRQHGFEVSFGAEFSCHGIALPDVFAASWIDEGGRRREFLRAELDRADLCLAN
ncbi:MAG: hypothetical protein QOH89_1694 [Pseudonocardiales bacterium]|nr:hypothetical protein [Pseudonocardiales bacterium]